MGNTCCTETPTKEQMQKTYPVTPLNRHSRKRISVEQYSSKRRVRDEKHIFKITFTKIPLGVVCTSSIYGISTYVTETDGKNDEVTDENLPKGSKLLKINDVDVEFLSLDQTTGLLIKLMNNLPIIMTFCHPDGLDKDELQDPNPKNDYTKE